MENGKLAEVGRPKSTAPAESRQPATTTEKHTVVFFGGGGWGFG